MTQYAKINADGHMLSTIGIPVPGDVGPHEPCPCPDDEEGSWVRCAAGWGWQGRISDSAVVAWNDGAPVWVEVLPLADVIARALDQIDTAADAARAGALLQKPTKAEEYTQAETQARAWADAGFAGEAPPDVASWARAKWRDNMTDRQAAEDILSSAERYRTMLSSIRDLRLARMEDARHAADSSEATEIVVLFLNDLSNLAKGIA